MAIKVTWKNDAEFSPLHAIAMACRGVPITDARLSKIIGETQSVISDRLAVADIDNDRFWSHLVATGNKGKDERSRVEAALTEAGCGALAADSISPTISGQLADFKIEFSEAYPTLVEQLPLRSRPLREQWEAVGPGLMGVIGKLTHRDLLVKRCTVALVGPACNGGGGANPATSVAWIEAVLANPHADVPEVLRLAWLLARLGLGRTEASKLVDSEHLPSLAEMALLPIMIEAGRELEIIGDLDVHRLGEIWHVRRATLPGFSDELHNWWSQLHEGETPFPVAMKALDRILTT